MKELSARSIVGAILLTLTGTIALSAELENAQVKAQAIERLLAENAGTEVRTNAATGTADFVRLPQNVRTRVRAAAVTSRNDAAMQFISRHATALGLRIGSADIKLRKSERDRLGRSHLTYEQEYGGVPVFGARLKAHFNDGDQLEALSGTLVPDLAVSIAPSRSPEEAADTAIQWVIFKLGVQNLSAARSRLMIFREGLAKGVPGDNHLAYEVEVSNGVNVREFVYVDAHTGKFIDQITGTPDALNRRAYDGNGGTFGEVLAIWPDFPFWVEGDAFPTSDSEADNMLLASKETYDLFANAFNRDSYDDAGAPLDSIFNRGYSCPNASWNGAFISFCPGLTTDDITGHEWGHAYTEYTDNLIYQWQPGALNESYSDVVGETVDRINGRDVLLPNNPRSDNSCSMFGGTPLPELTISGGTAAGSYFVTASVNEPPTPFTVGPTPMAASEPAGACTAITADVDDKIVIIDWTLDGTGASECGSGTRAANAIAAGAAGIIFVAPQSGLLNLGSNAAIASVQVSYDDGATIKTGLPADATIVFAAGTDDSVLWLMGEDSTAPGLDGALRDMYAPNCFGDPGKVSDEVYACDLAQNDAGGVHSNSGVPNHAFALMVDGGSFNGQTVNAIGLTKANHIQFRAKTHYQGPATDFAGHADALEQSCADLTGTNLASLTDGSPSGEIISSADCGEVAKAILAVELRTAVSQCGFEPLLAKDPPPLCPGGFWKTQPLFIDLFERGILRLLNRRPWKVSHDGTTPDFTERDWEVVAGLPGDRWGRAFFGPDPTYGTCAPGGDETAVLHADSPEIRVPKKNRRNPQDKALRMAFDHWVGSESGWDGGNVKISVNKGPWTLVAGEDFIYNPYNINAFGIDFLIPTPPSTNPIGGEQAFSGADGGSVEGSWGRSIIDLADYAAPGDKIRLRFDFGNDGCGGAFGWYVDNVAVYQCRN